MTMTFIIGKSSFQKFGLEMLRYLNVDNANRQVRLASQYHTPPTKEVPCTETLRREMPVVDKKSIAAAEEYEQNSDLIDRDVLLLKQWLLTQKHLPEIKDEMLKIFHHSCYYNLEKTKECIEAYYTIRTSAPELFRDRDVLRPEITQALDVVNIANLPVLDPKGNRIVYIGLGDPDISKFKYTDINKVAFMSMDAMIEKYGSDSGVIILQDMKGTKLGHLAKFSLSMMRKIFQYQQEANPIRLVSVHVVNVVPWIDKALTMMKPFMKKELLNLVHFHKSDTESLFEYIPKECLPSDYGGSLDSVDVLQAENRKMLESCRQFFAEDEKNIVDETKREKKKKNKKDVSEDIMFEKLDID